MPLCLSIFVDPKISPQDFISRLVDLTDAYCTSRDHYQEIISVLTSLSDEDKRKFHESAKNTFEHKWDTKDRHEVTFAKENFGITLMFFHRIPKVGMRKYLWDWCAKKKFKMKKAKWVGIGLLADHLEWCYLDRKPSMLEAVTLFIKTIFA